MSLTELDTLVHGLLPSLSMESAGRMPPEVAAKLPVDTAGAARVPAGVRLCFSGTATSLRLRLGAGSPTSAPAPTVGPVFTVWVGGRVINRVPVIENDWVDIPLPPRADQDPVEIYWPESVRVDVLDLQILGGTARPAPRGPRWVVYGDSISQGWSVSDAGLAWPSLLSRSLGLDLVNLGFAGSARGELVAATAVAGSEADLVTLAWGTNAWSSVPTDPAQIRETMRLFLTVIRQELPLVPVVVVSPIVRPGAERTVNRFGWTLQDLREALEVATLAFAHAHGDDRLTLVPGRGLVPEHELVDGVHPGDAGHATLASGVTPAMLDMCALLVT